MGSLIDNILKLIYKQPKEAAMVGSRSEREAKIKNKAGLVINVFAALLAFNTYLSGSLSSTIMNNTIRANDTWNFYQAKSIKQTQYEIASQQIGLDPSVVKKYQETVARYESDPSTGEGKRELFAAAKKLEMERDIAKHKSPWISYAGTAYQLSIVLLSASILSVSMVLFWSSFGVALVGVVLMSQGMWLWLS